MAVGNSRDLCHFLLMLFEREKELQRLSTLVADIQAGSGHVVALSGEAGIGKSALLNALAASLPASVNNIWGMCDALFTPRPLGPVHDIAEQLPGIDRVWRKEGGFELFSQVLSRLSQDTTPTVMIIEDVHWADFGTLDFIRFLGRRVTLCNVLLIISFRDDELDREHPLRRVLGELPSERMELAPLSIAAVRQLVADDGRDANRLIEITGGNPFFVSEILADGGDGEAHVPESVQDAVTSRLARLEKGHRALLEALSVIPLPIEPDLHCRWIDEADKWFNQSVAMGILITDDKGRLRFRHELARLATSSLCSSLELRQLHQKHLKVMLEQPQKYKAAEIIHHAKGAANAAAILAHAPAAAEKAALLGGHREAASYLETALDFIDKASPELAAELYENWAYEAGLALQVDDRVIEARRHALTLWRAIDRPDKIAENLRWLSRLHWYRGEAADESIRLFEKLGDGQKLAMAYSMRSQMMMLNSHMEEAINWGQRALQQAGDNPPASVSVHAFNNIGTAKLFLGQPEGIDDLQRSLKISLDNNLHEDAARAYTNLSEYAIDLRKLDLAEQVLDDGIAFDAEHDLDSWTYYLLGRKAQLRLEQGRLAEVIEIAENALEKSEQTLLMRLPALIMLGRAQLRAGEKHAARTLKQARADSLATGEAQYQIPVLFSLLEKAWLTGERSEAKEPLTALAKMDINRFSYWSRGEYAFWAKLIDIDAGCNRSARALCYGDSGEHG